jgi:signal transduction histidine kinase/DNA-binding response OmpR family regulator/HAMP domain-containing protein
MRLKNLGIGKQLALGLSLILAMVLFLGILAWDHSLRLWEEINGLYQHPLMVRRAIGDIKADILLMHRHMRDIVTSGNDAEQEPIKQSMDGVEIGVFKHFEVLRKQYLGPQNEVEELHSLFVDWKAIRVETLRILHSGDDAQATERTLVSGPGGSHVSKMLGVVQKISDFSRARADQFYQEAATHKTKLHQRLLMVLTAILLMSLVISYALIQGIRAPLQELTRVTQAFGQGHLEARCTYTAGNEIGTLAAAFNTLAETVQAEMVTRERVAGISAAMLQAEEARIFCQEVLSALLEQVEGQIGAVYLLNQEKSEFELFEAIGLGAEARHSFSAALREGEFGLALATGKIQRLTNIPEDTRFALAAPSGRFLPCEIMTIPISDHNGIMAMVSLAGVKPFSPLGVRVIEQVQSVLTARLNGVLAFRQVRLVSRTLDQQNRELEAQKNELQAQKIELERQQMEMASQARELTAQNTELERQKGQLGEANRLKSSFLSNMSHELRTPLNSVIALSGVLHRRLHDRIPAEEYGYLSVIERNGKQLLALINDILDLSRIEAGREELTLKSFSLSDLVQEVVAMLAPQAREKCIKLVSEVAPDVPSLRSDFTKCRHILQNLVGNAVKFTEVGRVSINVSRQNEEMVVKVIDTGIGMAPEQIPLIFEEFRQLDGSSSRKHGGTGLGLAIARKYTTLLGGRIAVTSAPGQGSTFTLSLPLEGPPENASTGTLSDTLSHASTDALPAGSTAAFSDALSDASTDASTAALPASTAALSDALTDTSTAALSDASTDALPDASSTTSTAASTDAAARTNSPKRSSAFPGSSVAPGHPPAQGSVSGSVSSSPSASSSFSTSGSPSSSSSGSADSSRGDKCLLLVEDSEPAIIQLKDILQNRGYRILVARNGREALEQISHTVPDAMILDLMMPEVDGFDVLRAIREKENAGAIPVLILTAKHVTREELSFLKQNHVHQLIQKGDVNKADLLAAVDRLLADNHRPVADPLPAVGRMPAPRGIAPRRPVILAIEDNPDNISTLAALLGDTYKLITAPDGPTGLEQARQQPPDVVCLDILLPGLDGLQTLAALRADNATRRIPVIALTARAMKGDREEFLAQGFNGYVSKPIDADLLLQTIREVLPHG